MNMRNDKAIIIFELMERKKFFQKFFWKSENKTKEGKRGSQSKREMINLGALSVHEMIFGEKKIYLSLFNVLFQE